MSQSFKHAPACSAPAPFVVAVLFEPEAGHRRVQHAEQPQVILDRRTLGQLDHWGRMVEDLPAAVEHEVVVGGDEREGDG